MSTGPTPGGSFSQIVHTVVAALADKIAKGFGPMQEHAREKIKEVQQNYPVLTTLVASVAERLAQDQEKRRLAEEAMKAARGERPGLTAEETKAMNDAIKNQPK